MVHSASTAARKRRRFGKEDMTGYLFMAPLLIGIFVFWVYPMVDTFRLSLMQIFGAKETYVGFQNYSDALTNPSFFQALLNTFYMGAIGIAIDFPLAFLIAVGINRVTIGKSFFKSMFFLPNIVSVVAMSIIFRFVFAPTKAGLINSLLGTFGVAPVGWFTNPRIAGVSVILMGCWKAGYDAIIFLAGLQSVPRELYEAAEIDGAGEARKLWSVTIPCMRPIFVFMFVMMCMAALKRFGDVYVIGTPTGNPSGALLTMVLYIFRLAFTAHNFGLASAVAYVLFLIILVVTVVNLKLTSSKDEGM